MTPLLEVRNLRKTYARGGGVFASGASKPTDFAAVDDVSFSVAPGETFSIVGESGCGKTTLARMLLRLIEPDCGMVLFEGRDLLNLSLSAMRAERCNMQMIFQDPFASLNPRMSVGEIVAEPLAIHKPGLSRGERAERAAQILRRVGLNEDALGRFPHEFSGGQRQRIGIARALILRPKLVIADEPVSALDVSIGAQVIFLLRELQQEFGLTYIFISHSLQVVVQMGGHIAVMRAGKFLEFGPAELVLFHPTMAYTKELLAAVPEVPRPARL
jgi:oligopeptide transport system ATP-binding protein